MDRIQHTFRQYTKHDLQHLLNIADHIYDFLPRRTKGDTEVVAINAVELTYLWLAILLHDVGMFVSDAEEKQTILDSEDYADFLRHNREREQAATDADKAGHAVTAQAIHDALFAEFIRRRHAERVHAYIDQYLKLTDQSGNAKAILTLRETDLSTDIGNLCESHNWGVRQSRDSRYPEKCVDKLKKRDLVGRTPVNMAYLACCLRLGDILDFDRSRTPLSAFHAIHFTETISVEEWNKHLSIKGIEVTEHRANYVAECETPADYVAVHHFLGWVDQELQDCLRLVREFPRDLAERYQLNLAPVVDRTQIRMKDPRYVAGGFRFQLEYDQIMRLLMDKSLYPDETMFLRELLQNALDACRYQKARAQDAGMDDKYVPRIQVWDGSTATRDPKKPDAGPRIVFQDNGVGMSLSQVENFFMRVGKSFYRSAEFNAERERLQKKGIHLDACSQFGIGFLSCFLGGDRIEVETFQHGSEPLKITIEGPKKYFLIERLPRPANAGIPFNSPSDPSDDSPPRHAGTKVTVFLRDGWRNNSSESDSDLAFTTLDAVAVNQEIPISVTDHKYNLPSELAAGRWDAGPTRRVPWEDRHNHSIHETHMIPSFFPLSNFDDSLRGFGAVWFLSEEDRPVPRKGDLSIAAGFMGSGVADVPFISDVRSLCRHFAGSNPTIRNRLANALARLNEDAQNFASFVDEVEQLFSRPLERTNPNLFRSLLQDDLNWAIELVQDLGALKPARLDWHQRTEEVEVLLSKDRQALAALWRASGISEGGKCTIKTRYELALFGIEAPGGFQTWDAAKGVANRHDWLASGARLHVDTYGDMAPEPAASRLFVPYERSSRVRGAVTRAFILHASRLLKENLHSADWKIWYNGFLSSWNANELAIGLEKTELLALHADMASEVQLVQARKIFAQSVATKHSQFGSVLLQRMGSGQTASQEVINKVAVMVKLQMEQIDETVQSLSEHLGWDVTKTPSF